MTGNKYGRLIVLSEAYKKNGLFYWNCVCECGKEIVANGATLRKGDKRSCGCLAKDVTKVTNTKHGLSGTRLQNIHDSMKSRCGNPNHDAYDRYGGRGIGVCEEWLNFDEFSKWAVRNGYEDILTIERVNVNDGYKPSNCVWIPAGEQKFNRRIPKTNKSGYPGVLYISDRDKFYTNLNSKTEHKNFIGNFDTFIEGFISRRKREYDVYEGRYLYKHPDLKEVRNSYIEVGMLGKFSKDGMIPGNIELKTNKEILWGIDSKSRIKGESQ